MALIFGQPFQILLEMTRREKIDPWDVDIEKLADIYMNRLLKKEEIDLRNVSRALLSASILLKMKSESPPYDGHSEDEEGDELLEDLSLGFPELGPLTIIRRSPRRITLSDLVGSFHDTLAEPSREKPRKKSEWKYFKYQVDEFRINIEERLEEFYRRISSLNSEVPRLTLTQLLSEKSRMEMGRALFLALFLNQRGKISLHQEEPLGPIYIEIKK